jgi:SH3-like domain-containing protein
MHGMMHRIATILAMILWLTAGTAAAMAATAAKTVQKPQHKPAAAAVAKKAPAPAAAKPQKPLNASNTPGASNAPKAAEPAKTGAATAAVKPQEEGRVSALPVPRFVTLGADEVNLRTGPGFRYPIRLVIRKSGLPVEILREFDVWRQVRDRDGDEGWVHESMLSGRRAVIIKGEMQTLLDKPQDDARPVVRLEPGVIAGLVTCRNDWCRLKIASYDGWLKRNDVWGIYPREAFQE